MMMTTEGTLDCGSHVLPAGSKHALRLARPCRTYVVLAAHLAAAELL